MMKKATLFLLLAILLVPKSASALSPTSSDSTKIIDFDLQATVSEDRVLLSWDEVPFDPDSKMYNQLLTGGGYDTELGKFVFPDDNDIAGTYFVLSNPTLNGEQERFQIGDLTSRPYADWKLIGEGAEIVNQTDHHPFHGEGYYAVCQGHQAYGIACSLPLKVSYDGGVHTITNELSLNAAQEDDKLRLSWNEYGQESNNYHYKLIRHYDFSEASYDQDPYYLFSHHQDQLFFGGEGFGYLEEVSKKNTAYTVCVHDGVNDECSEPLIINPQGGDVLKTEELNVQVEMEEGLITLSWSGYQPEGFGAYRVLSKELNNEFWNGDESTLEMAERTELSGYEMDASQWNGSAEPRTFVFQVCAEAWPQSYCNEPQLVTYQGSEIILLPNMNVDAFIQGDGSVDFSWNDYGAEGIQNYNLLILPSSESDILAAANMTLKEAIIQYGFYGSIPSNPQVQRYEPGQTWESVDLSEGYLDLTVENYFSNDQPTYFAICAYTDSDEYYCSLPDQIEKTESESSDVIIVDALKLEASVIENGEIQFTWNEYKPDGFVDYRLIQSMMNSAKETPDALEKIISNSLINQGYSGPYNGQGVLYPAMNVDHPDHESDSAIMQIGGGYFSFFLCAYDGVVYHCSKPENRFIHPNVSSDLILDFQWIDSNLEFTWKDGRVREKGSYVLLSYPTFDLVDLERAENNWTEASFDFTETKTTQSPKSGVSDYMVCYTEEEVSSGDNYSFSALGEFEICSASRQVGHFPDAVYHPYREAIEDLQISRIIEGNPNGLYEADEPINRAAFAAIVMRHLHGPEMDFKKDELVNCREDVQDQWFAAPLCLAIKQSIMSGYPDGLVRPEREIQLDEAAKILTQAYQLTPGKEGVNWYDQYISAIEVFDPNIAKKEPAHLLTRGEMAKLIWGIKKHDDAYWNHYHTNEAHNGNLYLIKRSNESEDMSLGLVDQLWKYDENDEGSLLFSGKGIDFRVSPDENYIATTGSDMDEGLDLLRVIDLEGRILATFNAADLSDDPAVIIQLLGWNDEGNRLWVTSLTGGQPIHFFVINAEDWSVVKYDVPEIEWGVEYALNFNTGKIAYTNLPKLIYTNDLEDFKANQVPVTLFIYDLLDADSQAYVINDSVAMPFGPNWIDEDRLKYNDPESEERVVKTIDLEELEIYKDDIAANPVPETDTYTLELREVPGSTEKDVDKTLYLVNTETNNSMLIKADIEENPAVVYENPVYQNGNVYFVKSIFTNEAKDEYLSRELWKYADDGSSEKLLYSAENPFYLISTDDSLIAADDHGKLIVLNEGGVMLRVYTLKELSGSISDIDDFILTGWSEDNQILWGELHTLDAKSQIPFSIDMNDWSIEWHDVG